MFISLVISNDNLVHTKNRKNLGNGMNYSNCEVQNLLDLLIKRKKKLLDASTGKEKKKKTKEVIGYSRSQ